MAFALAGTMAFSRVASADATTEQKRVQAEALNAEGKALAVKKDFVGAREKFLQAYAVWPVPGMLFNAARTDQVRGEYADAWGLYRTYLALPASERVTAKDRKDAEQYAGECEAKICRLDVRGAKRFTVDGKTRPEPYVVAVGQREIVMEGVNGTRKASVVCMAGTPLIVEYEPPKVDVAPPPKLLPPITPPPVEKMETGSWVVPGILAGVGVVGIGVGAGLGLAAGSERSFLAKNPATCNSAGVQCPANRDAYDSGRTLGTASIVGYAVGGAALLVAVIVTSVSRPWQERPKQAAALTPWMGLNGGGFVVQGGF